MAWNDKYTTSIKGRRLGLQQLTTSQTAGSRGTFEVLVGPEALRPLVSTAPTTSANLRPYGVHFLNASSAGSSQVYTLDPPVSGLSVTLVNSTNATAFVKVSGTNSEVIKSTIGSTQTVLSFGAGGGMITLTGLTSAAWICNATSGTSSQSATITLTNTT